MIAGAGIGFLPAPASTAAAGRSIGASHGEDTGITRTVRSCAAGVRPAVLGTSLTRVGTGPSGQVPTLRAPFSR